MPRKNHDWSDGATLDEHTKKKHTILREYFRQYLFTRCQLPQQENFRLIIVDGFSGAGLYTCGSYGSPIIFIDVLDRTLKEINIGRVDQGMRTIQIECLLILNDFDKSTVDQLSKNIAPLLAGAKEGNSKLHIEVEYHSQEFDEVYLKIKKRVKIAKCGNVLFNLDQYGHSGVNTDIIRDIMLTWKSAEAFLTFSIDAILAYISPDQKKNKVSLKPEVHKEIYALLKSGSKLITKKTWLGAIERIIFENLKGCAPHVSPFSINNPDGWRYWLMHFANSYRARQVYNNMVLPQS